MKDFHIETFRKIITEHQLLKKIETINAIKGFLSTLGLLKNKENAISQFEYLYNLNKYYNQIVSPFFNIEIYDKGENIIQISGKEQVLYDIEYGVIDSTIDFSNLQFQKNHRIIIRRVFFGKNDD
ncbi:hypothetical protein CDIK_0201 [Cucumispora dikerogammari]|nr:hypothetical protein CDIK_0201 [Cucumispora dikerogammari]